MVHVFAYVCVTRAQDNATLEEKRTAVHGGAAITQHAVGVDGVR